MGVRRDFVRAGRKLDMDGRQFGRLPESSGTVSCRAPKLSGHCREWKVPLISTAENRRLA